MSIMYVRCVSLLGHTCNSLTCSYLPPGMRQVSNAAGHSHGGSNPSRTRAYIHSRARALLPSILTPTLLLSSTVGQEVPSDVGLYLRQRIPGARLVELPGADHFAFATRPALVNLLIEQVFPARS